MGVPRRPRPLGGVRRLGFSRVGLVVGACRATRCQTVMRGLATAVRGVGRELGHWSIEERGPQSPGVVVVVTALWGVVGCS